jgi:Flp pilus assembly protein CpaB
MTVDGPMSDPNNSKQGSGSSLARVLAGGAVGFILGAFTMNLVGYGAGASSQQKPADPFAGAMLLPVVVASQDIPEGTPITFDHIQQRNVPAQLVTSSVVKPEAANYIMNVPLLVPVQKGDMLLWSQFEAKRAKSHEAAPVSDTQVQ